MTKKPVVVQPFTVADYLLTRLKQLNVTEVFQIPGDYVKHFTQALEYFPGVNAIGAINELDAAYAADAYGRTRGLGAVSLQYGVSTFSALNAIAGAYVEFSPVVVISATPGADARQITKMYDVLYHHSTGNLRADQEVYRQVTVAAETLSTSVGAPEKIDNLLIAAITCKRPVYIECYKEVWGEPCPKPSGEVLRPLVFKSEPLALENAVAAAWGQITAAKHPMIFAGVEVLRHGLSDLLQQLIDASGFLYTTTTLGKTVLDEKGNKFVMTYGVSSALYVATNAYGLSQGSFIGSAAWQCIGFETGAASGAQFGSGKRAWTVAGDGGFMMVCQSLSTLARNKLNAVMFVMSNAVYAIEQVYVDITAFEPGPEHTFDTFDILPKWDYLALAKAFGAKGYRVTTVSELNAVLQELKKPTDLPSLVEVVIPEKDLPRQMLRLGVE